jgi:hypothetical protein
MRFGKQPPTVTPRTVHPMIEVAGGIPLPPLPNSSAYYQAVTTAASADPRLSWGTFENTPTTGDFNDCTIAAAGHMTQLWTANIGGELKFSDGDVSAAYKHFVGDDTKKDLKMRDVLEYWRTVGIGNHKIQAYGQIQNQNVKQIKYSISLLGGCYIGLGLPSALFDQHTDPTAVQGGKWGSTPNPPDGDYAPNPENGHTIAAVGFDDDSLSFVTWGKQIQMTWQFLKTYMDEAWGLVSPDWVSSGSGKSPSGFDLTGLGFALEALQRIPI